MSVDPTRNVVVFQLDREGDQSAMAHAPTLDDDCVQQAWELVRRSHLARADEVTALYSEWEPSAHDARFIADTFPSAKVMYSLQRPEPDGWDAAFQSARQLMEQHMAQPGGEQAEHASDEGSEFLPVVWSASAPQAEILDFLPHQPLVPGALFVSVAWAEWTPRGTLGMSHLTHRIQEELGNMPIADLLDVAYDNLRVGLRIEGERSELGDLVTMHRNRSLAAAAVALPDFHERLSSIIQDERLIVGLPCQDHLLVTGASSRLVDDVHEAVLSSPHQGGELVPSVLLVEQSGIQLIAQHS